MYKIIILFSFIQGFLPIYSICPDRCSCRHIKPQAEWLKVICKDNLNDIMDIDFNSVSIEMVHLDLSKNDISDIKIDIFKNLSNLKRLNLSANKIALLDEGIFEGLINLERLDLSRNLISSINFHTFKRLPNLKRLKLNGNKIETLKEGTFHGLPSLKQLDISANPWNCDCNLFWLSYWIQNNSIKFNPPPECNFPLSLKGKLVKKLRIIKEFECKSSTPTVEIVPNQNQIVFAGDAISLKCRALSISNDKFAKLKWLWTSNITTEILDLSLYDKSESNLINVHIENKNIVDSGIVASSLNIDPVKEEHNGQWNCLLVSTHGNMSRAINVIVISNRTQYCPLTVTKSNKGIYAWPRTVVGWRVELPCESSSIPITSIQFSPQASQVCNSTGHWENLNTEYCPYISPITKILEQFSTVNISLTKLSLPKGSLLETIKKLKNITGEGTFLTDPVEINFMTQILENYASYLIDEKELGTMLIDVVNILLNLPKSILKDAEVSYSACTRLIKTVELIVEFTPSSQLIQLHKKNMALEEYRIKPDNFAGLTCTWYNNSENKYVNLLHCSMNNKTAIINTNMDETTIEASIQIPASLFKHVKSNALTYQLMISMYTDNKLFPNLNDQDNTDVTSSIAGSKLIGTTVYNLTEPVYIMLKAPLIQYTNSKPIPVVWDSSLNKTGAWSSNGCHLSNFLNNLIIFHCDRLGYYGLLQDKSILHKNGKSITGAKFKYSNPAIYIGSFILIVCLICTTITYICCFASIVMPKKVKHCVINTWVAITLLCFLYTSGIQQTENFKICQGVGIGLHYLSLCCLFWMTVSASNMYKRLSKLTVDPITDDELHEQPIRKPLLGLYLVGWGIALIICGISGAINLREYAGYAHCFLTSTPSLAALFIPSVILLVYLMILHTLIRCKIRNVDLNGQLSEGTQATENVDLELLEPNPNPGSDRVSLHSSQTVSSEVEDQEHSQMSQLKGLIIVTILYLIAWLCAAMTTVNLYTMYIPYKETLFAVLYAVSTSSLGMFILLFYGIARSDVRAQWMMTNCLLKKNRCCKTRNVCDINSTIPIHSLVPLTASQLSNMQVTSDTNSLDSTRFTQKSQNSCNTSKIESSQSHVKPNHMTNANLVMLHRQQYRSNNSVTTFNTESALASVEMFYNPHQSGVARKFFKKQRRNMMKNNSLEPKKQRNGDATSDNGSRVSVPRRSFKLDHNIERNLLGNYSKINNTNKHVKMNSINDLKNTNILSDNSDRVSDERNLALRYVIGQENLNKNSGKINIESLSIQNGENQHKCKEMMNHVLTVPESKIMVQKKKLNDQLQCSHDYSSTMESRTLIEKNEQSKSNISNIYKSMLSRSYDDVSTNLSIFETISKNRYNKIVKHRTYDMHNYHSGSLSSLSLTEYSIVSLQNKLSYSSSFNDARSINNLHFTNKFKRILGSNFINGISKIQHATLIPFVTTKVISTTSDTKTLKENEEVNSIVNAVVVFVEENKSEAGEILELHNCGEKKDRNDYCHNFKYNYANNKQSNSVIIDDSDGLQYKNNEDDDFVPPDLMNVKKETSV